ncbi:MAG TPA: heavy metal translocating P-type ATPase [Aeromicrobium sp.]|nr:heavy metal translocating P-type ATPase [Aeromicrobium sp.]
MAATCTVCELHAESTFRIEGMDCREEVALIERRFKNLRGLEAFHADLMGQRLHVKYDAAQLSTSAIAGAVADAGMRAWLEHEVPVSTGDRAARTRLLMVSASAAWFAAALALSYAGAGSLAVNACYGASMLSALPLTARKAWVAVKQASLDIHILMLLAAAGAVALGQWSEGAAVVFLFAIAQMLEAYTLERARTAVRSLIDLAPTDVLLRGAQTERRVPVDTIAPGDVILVKPGEKLALDGVIVEGSSALNQAPVTGESLPVDKAPGDEVFAGSINGYGALDVRVTRLRRDTRLARIIHMVEQAQAQRAPSQTFIERFSSGYTPVVIGLAVWLSVMGPAFMGGDPRSWFYRSLVLLVVSCPCALVISTPVSIVAALASAARKGVLIKGGAHLERAAAIRCVAFDKTGTLTRGVPEVVDVMALDGASPDVTVSLAASIEQRSEHPIAAAIVEHARASGIAFAPGSAVTALAGRGAEGRVNGAVVLLGNHRLFEERNLCNPLLHARIEALSTQGRTPVLVARDGTPIGLIALADRPRVAARESIEMLREQGVGRVVMLTGDSQGTATAIARELGLDDFRAELMPEDKVAAVEELRRQYGLVAMVGDGINDAPALASADVGIAMGAAGSEAALETADVALMADDLLKLPYTLRVSRAAMRNIRVNLAIALGLKAIFVIAAVTGVATLWMAILADTGATVIVVANALRLLRAD